MPDLFHPIVVRERERERGRERERERARERGRGREKERERERERQTDRQGQSAEPISTHFLDFLKFRYSLCLTEKSVGKHPTTLETEFTVWGLKLRNTLRAPLEAEEVFVAVVSEYGLGSLTRCMDSYSIV